MRYENQRWVLSTGRVLLRGARGVIGVADDYGELVAFAGFDGELLPSAEDLADDEVPVTDAERAEIADHMIALWQRWKVEGR